MTPRSDEGADSSGGTALPPGALREVRAGVVTQTLSDVSLNVPLSQLIRRAPVTCASGASLHHVLSLMRTERVGSVVVVDAQQRPRGIFTLHDLLQRVAVSTIVLDSPIDPFLSPDPLSVPMHAYAQEAALMMARHGVGHLCVVDGGRLVGVVSERDLFSLQRIGIVPLARTIAQAQDIPTLAKLARDIHRLADQILVHGASVDQLTQILTLLNDHVTRRAVALCVAEHGHQPAPFIWLSFGSEGRQEQTLKTDQDNGILFEAPARNVDAVRRELLPLARRINEALDACGYPLCRGNIMASNPACCLTLSEWRERFFKWIEHGAPEHLLEASIYFDFRVLIGDAGPAEQLREDVFERVRKTPRFLFQMTQSALHNTPPLGFMRDFSVERRGEHRHAIDLKLRGTMPFVDGARIIALANGIADTNTLARLQAAARRGRVPTVEAEAWCEAYSFIQLLRMRHHRTQERAGKALGNHLDPDQLNELDKAVLKESFRQARQLQSAISLDYLR